MKGSTWLFIDIAVVLVFHLLGVIAFEPAVICMAILTTGLSICATIERLGSPKHGSRWYR